jgi:peptidyl-prolyl cis-trans isomerase C
MAMSGLLAILLATGGVTDEQTAVVARVNGAAVTAAEAEHEFRQAYGDREFAPADRQRLFRAALDQTIDRQLILAYLAKTGQAASEHDVDLALVRFEKELQAQNLTLDQHCEKVGLTKEQLRASLRWKLSWKHFAGKYLTADNLRKYFEQNRREFDGTQLRVSQILLKAPAPEDAAAIAALEKKAAEIRAEITGGKTTFELAAKKSSQAPSSQTGGDIGWIERHRPMPEEYSQAAFALQKGEISQPLVTPFGIHLLTVTDEKPGTHAWQDVEAELRPAVTLYLFRWLADRERAGAKLEYVKP